MLLAVLPAGCGDKPKYTPEQLASMPLAIREGLPEVTGGFVLAVGTEPIEADAVIGPVFDRLAQIAQRTDYERFAQAGRPAVEMVLREEITRALLYQQAKKEYGEDAQGQIDQAAQAEVRRFVMQFGGDYARAEQAIRQMGMDWGSFEQYQKKMILRQSYMSQKMPKEQAVTYSDLTAAYEAVKGQLYTRPGTVQYRLIDIQPARLDINDANTNRDEYAIRLALDLVARINKGEDFGELAKQYSHGHTAQLGGLSAKVDPASLAEPYDVLAGQAAKLKPGEVAGSISAPGHIFIMQLVEFQPASIEPFEKVQEEVKAKVMFERRKQAFDKLNAELFAQASVGDRTRFVDYCLREIYKMANK